MVTPSGEIYRDIKAYYYDDIVSPLIYLTVIEAFWTRIMLYKCQSKFISIIKL